MPLLKIESSKPAESMAGPPRSKSVAFILFFAKRSN
jgi:hypothetical protein